MTDELREEQDHVDRAWAARERSRVLLAAAAGASAGGKTAVAVGRAARRAADELGAPDDPVVMGRIDTTDGRVLHIGKHAVHDQDQDILVMGWKAPAAAPYFTATVDDACGLVRKRTFNMARNTVLGFEDLVFAEITRRIEQLSEHERWGVDDAVLRELDASRTGEMRDIVATIHAAQYELIRSPLDQLLVVQGGPGTGKTVVALHRVSWLLYQHRDTLAPDQMLVIGPNPTFTRYIRAVLPGLGDADVAHQDLRSLGPVASTGRAESDDVARLKGEGRMASLVARAMAQRVRYPERVDRLEVPLGDGTSVQLDRGTIEPELQRRLAAAPSYTAGRAAMRAWLTATVGERARWGTRVPPASVESALERVWPSLSAAAFLRDLLSSRERLLSAAGKDFTAAEIQLLARVATERVSEETWSDSDVPLLDEAEALLGGHVPTYAHVVLDEAQDLSPMQLRSVHRRCPSGSMTVVGDLAQSAGLWARESWDEVVETLSGTYPVRVEQLLLGYRVPRQVYALASQLLPHIAPTLDAPTVVRDGPAEPDLRQVDSEEVPAEAVRAARDHAGRGLFVGMICPDELRDDVTRALRHAEVSFTDTRDGTLGSSINLVAPTIAKGLEFEAVVVLEPEILVAESEHGLRLLYVALTRTTKHLTVVHSGRVLPVGAHDGPSVGQERAEGIPPVPVVHLPPAPHAPSLPRVPAPPGTLPTAGSGLATALPRAVARELAAHIRTTVAPSAYDAVLHELRIALTEEEAP